MHWLRKVLKSVSFAAVLFVFQACYGTERDYYETNVVFHVVDDLTGEPLKDVCIYAQHLNSRDSSNVEYTSHLEEYTDVDGIARVWTVASVQRYTVVDRDSMYTPVDTIVNTMDVDTLDIRLKKAR